MDIELVLLDEVKQEVEWSLEDLELDFVVVGFHGMGSGVVRLRKVWQFSANEAGQGWYRCPKHGLTARIGAIAKHLKA